MSSEETVMRHWLLKITTMVCMGIIAMLGLGACKSAKALENDENGKGNEEKVKPIDRDPGRVRLMYGVRPTPYSTKIQEEQEFSK
jgi:hypothetical protein